MLTLLIVGFLAGAVIVAVTVIVAINGGGGRLRVGFLAVAVAFSVTAYWSTFHYVRTVNSNTRIHGWPIPYIAFQREDAESPWLDFVGPISVFAYPMNLTLFMLTPSLVFLVFAFVKFRRDEIKSDG